MGKDHRGEFPCSIHLMRVPSKRNLLGLLRVTLIVPFMGWPLPVLASEDLFCLLRGYKYVGPDGREERLKRPPAGLDVDLTVTDRRDIIIDFPGMPSTSFACDSTRAMWSCIRPGQSARWLPSRGVLTLDVEYPQRDGRRVGYAWECERR